MITPSDIRRMTREELTAAITASDFSPAVKSLALMAIMRAPEEDLNSLRDELATILEDAAAGKTPDISAALGRLGVPVPYRPVIEAYAKRLFLAR